MGAGRSELASAIFGTYTALVGFDDIYPATLCDPPLTTVRQPIRGIGERACEQLIERIATPTLRPSVELLPTELVIRSSCGCPPGTVARRLVPTVPMTSER